MVRTTPASSYTGSGRLDEEHGLLACATRWAHTGAYIRPHFVIVPDLTGLPLDLTGYRVEALPCALTIDPVRYLSRSRSLRVDVRPRFTCSISGAAASHRRLELRRINPLELRSCRTPDLVTLAPTSARPP